MVTPPRFEVGSLGTNGFDPLPDSIRDELWSANRSDVGRNTPDDEQVGQGMNYIRLAGLSLHPDRQAFAVALIDDVLQPLQFSKSIGPPNTMLLAPAAIHLLGNLHPPRRVNVAPQAHQLAVG